MGKRVGYFRLKTENDEIKKQDALDLLNVDNCEKIYYDIGSGLEVNRPQLDKMIAELNIGDVVVVLNLGEFAKDYHTAMKIIDRIFITCASICSFEDNELGAKSVEYDFEIKNSLGIFLYKRLENGSYWEIEKSNGKAEPIDDWEYFMRYWQVKLDKIRRNR